MRPNSCQNSTLTLEVEAALHEEDGALYGLLIPDVQVVATGGVVGPAASRGRDTLDYAVGIGWKIGPGDLLDVGRREQAEARRSMAEIELERVRQRVVDELRSILAQLVSRGRQIAIADQSVKDADEALKLNQGRQAAGAGLPLEFLEA